MNHNLVNELLEENELYYRWTIASYLRSGQREDCEVTQQILENMDQLSQEYRDCLEGIFRSTHIETSRRIQR